MTVDFNDYFWGEKNNGFDVLYHNMKFGLVASKELSEFLREKSIIEEQNSKMMSKLAHKASTGTLNSTFAPVWTILRTSAEKLSTLHLQMVQKLSELVKDVAKYADELHKKHKSVKEEESQTLECVQSMQASTAAVQKQRDLYSSKGQELEKLRKDNASHKDIEKLETKLRKLQDEYKSLLDKHNPIKNDFEKRMTQSCKRFQEIEEVHLRQMKEFLSTYLELLQTNHDMVGQVHSDFKRQFLDMTVDKLLEQFVLNKYTGLEKPDVPELEFIQFTTQQQASLSATRLNQNVGSTIASNVSNSNSATSIQGAIMRISSDQRGSSGENALTIGGASGSTGSFGSGSITEDVHVQHLSRPTSPELLNMHNDIVATTTSSSTTSTVKSNFLNWFSSNNLSSKQQQQQPQLQVNNSSNTVITTTTATAITTNSVVTGTATSSTLLTTMPVAKTTTPVGITTESSILDISSTTAGSSGNFGKEGNEFGITTKSQNYPQLLQLQQENKKLNQGSLNAIVYCF